MIALKYTAISKIGKVSMKIINHKDIDNSTILTPLHPKI